MPHRYSLQSTQNDGKRVRAVKKMDESFTDDFNLGMCKKEVVTERTVPSNSQRQLYKDKKVESAVSTPLKTHSAP
jgi:hypothetical protein